MPSDYAGTRYLAMTPWLSCPEIPKSPYESPKPLQTLVKRARSRSSPEWHANERAAAPAESHATTTSAAGTSWRRPSVVINRRPSETANWMYKSSTSRS